MIRCLAAALLLCAFGLAPALGAEPPPVKPAADAARKAADDPKGLRALVTAPEPDAWLVAAELLRAGESKVARALAAAGKAPGGAGLAAAVEASRAPAATLAALTKAHADSGRAAWKDVVAALEGLAPGTGLHVVEAAWLAARARDELAFDDTASARRLRLEAADLYRTAGEAAPSGWPRV